MNPNVLPFPGPSLWTKACPPCASTMVRTTPESQAEAARTAGEQRFELAETLEEAREQRGGDADAGVGHFHHRLPVIAIGAHGDAAVPR